MDLRQLDTFVRVAELGSFTRAATVLRIAQPALSRQVRLLEVELRQTLFERNGRGVTPTEAGRRLLEHARGILQQVQRARDDLEDLRGAASGRLAVALPPSLSRSLTSALVAAFRERLPRATLCVVEGLSNYALEWLAIGRVDLALVYNAVPTAAVELQPVLEEPLYLVSARRGSAKALGQTIALPAVAEHALAIPSRPHAMRMLLESALAGVGRRAQVAWEIESIPAILDLVEQGAAHAVLARNAIRASGREPAFRLRPIGPPPLVARLWIATSAQRPRGPLLDQSSALIRELLLSDRADQCSGGSAGGTASPSGGASAGTR